MARSGKNNEHKIRAAKRDYWERLRRSSYYLRDFQYLAKEASKDAFDLEKAVSETAAMARYYYLKEMISPTADFSDEVATKIRFTDAMIKLKVHDGYWPLQQSSFAFPIDVNEEGGCVLAPYKRSESLIFGRYLQVAIDITQPLENIATQVTEAAKMARVGLVDDVTTAANKKVRQRPEDNRLAFKAWDMYHINKIKLADIGQTLWNKKDREDAKRKAYDAIKRAEHLISTVVTATYTKLNGPK